MTWLGNPDGKPTDAKKAKLEADRAALVKQIEAMGTVAKKGFRYPHQARQHNDDLRDIAAKITKIDAKLGRPVDRNSGA